MRNVNCLHYLENVKRKTSDCEPEVFSVYGCKNTQTKLGAFKIVTPLLFFLFHACSRYAYSSTNKNYTNCCNDYN